MMFRPGRRGARSVSEGMGSDSSPDSCASVVTPRPPVPGKCLRTPSPPPAGSGHGLRFMPVRPHPLADHGGLLSGGLADPVDHEDLRSRSAASAISLSRSASDTPPSPHTRPAQSRNNHTAVRWRLSMYLEAPMIRSALNRAGASPLGARLALAPSGGRDR
jgi:hypothetical protein